MPTFDFDPLAEGLSLRNARLLGQAAAVSYEDPGSCKRWAAGNGLDGDFDFIDRLDTQGFVAQNERVVIVAFRGTQPNQAADWLTDVRGVPVSWSSAAGKAHRGFCLALGAAWRQQIAGKSILPELLFDVRARPVWITGHSLGGALAILCAAHAALIEHIPVQGVYTFGQPRVGDGAFSDTLHLTLGSRIFRFINNRDIVPRVPLFGMTYRHCGTEIFFDHEGKRVHRSSAIEDLRAALRLAFLGLDLDPIAVAGRIFAEAGVKAALGGNLQEIIHELAHAQELARLGDLRAIAARGVQNITDHNMITGYLPHLGVPGFHVATA